MSSVVKRISFEEPSVCERDWYRYAACKAIDDHVKALFYKCFDEARDQLRYQVCYRELPVRIQGDVCDFEAFRVTSTALAKRLSDCTGVIVFAATVGVPLDRLIARYCRLSPAKALMLDAIGTERIEALCDVFCQEVAGDRGKVRFSPGYADVPLAVQRDIFRLLDCEKNIGLCLNDSLLMSPSKSVTAFIGLSDTPAPSVSHKCERCPERDCAFRGDV